MNNHFTLLQVFKLMAVLVQILLIMQTNGIATMFSENDGTFPAAFLLLWEL